MVDAARHHIERFQFKVIGLVFVLLLEKEQSFQVVVKHLTFAVGKLEEAAVDFI